ncbi:MAG: rod shape-determining protein MreC [Thiomicrospira sp.]|nr:rod shape-determining protein MreC [Thiomicrospira sp.]
MNVTSSQQDSVHFVVVFLLSIFLMVLDYHGQYMGTVRNLLMTTLEPLERLAGLPSHLHQRLLANTVDLASLESENSKLRTENMMLKAQLQRLSSLEMETQRLQRLLGTTGRMDIPSLKVANVVHFSNHPLSQFLTVNKGQIDQIHEGQPVIDANGVLGQIINTALTSSRVLLITDPDHQIPVRIQRTGQRGILSGAGNNMTQLEFIPLSSSVEVGDILLSSGLGGTFPPGYPVAEITDISETPGLPYLTISAKPIADLNSSYEVLILSAQPELAP